MKGEFYRLNTLVAFLCVFITSVFAQNSYIEKEYINIKKSQQSLKDFVSMYNSEIDKIYREISKLNNKEISPEYLKDTESIQELINQYSKLKQELKRAKQNLIEAYTTFRIKIFKVLEEAPISQELRDYYYKHMIDNQHLLEEAFDLLITYTKKKQEGLLFLKSLNTKKRYIIKDNKLSFLDKNNLDKFNAYQEEAKTILNKALEKLEEFTFQHRNLIKEINERFR